MSKRPALATETFVEWADRTAKTLRATQKELRSTVNRLMGATRVRSNQLLGTYPKDTAALNGPNMLTTVRHLRVLGYALEIRETTDHTLSLWAVRREPA